MRVMATASFYDVFKIYSSVIPKPDMIDWFRMQCKHHHGEDVGHSVFY